MGCFVHPPATVIGYINTNSRPPPPLRYNSKITTTFCVSAVKLNNDNNNINNDPLFLAATTCAFLRSKETLRQDPLFVDPYAACLVPPEFHKEMVQDLHPYCVASKFIDDKLLHTLSLIDGVKQVVLLTDGMDTRPYRLHWQTSTIIFDISPERIFKTAAEKLEGVGAKIPKSCLFYHIPLESSDIKQSLQFRGYNGNRPSVWAIQGFPMKTLANFEELLSIISSLAMKGSFFVGELPAWLSEAEMEIESNTKQWMDKLFMSNGFRMEMINYKGVADSSEEELASAHYNNVLFLAEQLRYSDDQMEEWRRQFQRVEDEGDEDGFEEL